MQLSLITRPKYSNFRWLIVVITSSRFFIRISTYTFVTWCSQDFCSILQQHQRSNISNFFISAYHHIFICRFTILHPFCLERPFVISSLIILNSSGFRESPGLTPFPTELVSPMLLCTPCLTKCLVYCICVYLYEQQWCYAVLVYS